MLSRVSECKLTSGVGGNVLPVGKGLSPAMKLVSWEVVDSEGKNAFTWAGEFCSLCRKPITKAPLPPRSCMLTLNLSRSAAVHVSQVMT